MLQSRDRIIVLSDYQDRAAAISPYIANLERRTSVGELPKIVRSGGAVKCRRISSIQGYDYYGSY